MKKTLTLKNPIMINGQAVGEIEYDTNEITAALFAEAEARSKIAAGTKNVTITPSAEFAFALHPYLFFAAAVAVNAAYDFADLERIHGADLIAAMEIGRDFMLGSESPEESTSAEPSETTPELSTPALPSSPDGDSQTL